MVSMISRRHRAVVVKVAFVVGVLYLMGMLKVARDTPSKEEERMEANDPEDQSGERPKIEEPNFEPPKLEPPILELPDEKAANQDGNEIEDTERENEKKRLEEEKERLNNKEKLNEKEKEKKVLEEKEKKRLEEKEEEKAEDKELDLVVAPPKRPEGPGEMGKPYEVGKKATKYVSCNSEQMLNMTTFTTANS